jgi:hypothetical protein
MSDIETRIGEWRTAITRSRAVDTADADELEDNLREQISDLEKAGLTPDEAFLIAAGRLGEVSAVSAEFAREHGDRLWKQLALARPGDDGRRTAIAMLVFAVIAAVVILVARLIATDDAPSAGDMAFGEPTATWFLRNLGLFLVAPVAGYFAVVRRMPWPRLAVLAAAVAVVAIAVNVFPYTDESDTAMIAAFTLPVVVWFAVGVAYVTGDVNSGPKRMDFIRFSGEWLIYYTLIAIGGAVLLVLTGFILMPIAPDVVDDVFAWVQPSGAAAAAVVAAWLVEAKKSIVENLAPVLTAIFTPLFAVMLVIAVVVYFAAGIGREFDRDLLAVFDALLLVVVGLVVYGISARRPGRVMDAVRLVAVVAAIVLDILVLVSMFTRIGEFGFTPNRVAALGLNLLLLVNLLGSAWLMGRRRRVEPWQVSYVPVIAAWALAMVLVLPPAFAFA